MSQISRRTRVRQLAESVWPGRTVNGYANLIAARLRKLADEGSTGMLPVSGRGDGAIFFRGGQVVYAESSRTSLPGAAHERPGRARINARFPESPGSPGASAPPAPRRPREGEAGLVAARSVSRLRGMLELSELSSTRSPSCFRASRATRSSGPSRFSPSARGARCQWKRCSRRSSAATRCSGNSPRSSLRTRRSPATRRSIRRPRRFRRASGRCSPGRATGRRHAAWPWNWAGASSAPRSRCTGCLSSGCWSCPGARTRRAGGRLSFIRAVSGGRGQRCVTNRR